MIRDAPFLSRPDPGATSLASSKTPAQASDSVRSVAQVGQDGSEFFRRANRLAADPRVKFVFGHAAEEYEKAASALKSLAKGKGRPDVPALFPFSEWEKIECYVCGFEADVNNIPEICPSCGAARYAFEREIPQDRAWELVAKTTREVQAFARKAASGVKDAKAKEALASASTILKGLAEEAKEERARIVHAP